MPLVTICLPVYNGERYLALAMDSVLSQQLTDWRLIVGDNCSSDRTAEILARYQDPRITIIRHASNIGMVANWRFLVEKVDSPFFCILAADDYFYPNHLTEKTGILEAEPRASFVHSVLEIIDADGATKFIYREPLRDFEPSREIVARFLKTNFVNIAGAVMRTDAVRATKTEFDPRFPVICDWHFFMRMTLLSEGFAYAQNPTSTYRYHPASIARQTEGKAPWLIQERELQLDLLHRFRERWEGIVNVDEASAALTENLWRMVLREWRWRRHDTARRLWELYRQYHSPAELITAVPVQAVRELRTRLLS